MMSLTKSALKFIVGLPASLAPVIFAFIAFVMRLFLPKVLANAF